MATIDRCLQSAVARLNDARIATARLDALIILEHVLQKSRAYILAHPEVAISDAELSAIQDALQRRICGEPIAYAIGKKEFYGRTFVVSSDVLVPRPESEAIIEALRALNPKPHQRLLDVGTGSGILAITAKKEFNGLSVTACDISEEAVKIAQENATNHEADVNFIQSDLFQNIEGRFDYIIANLPYVPRSLPVSAEVDSEPDIAVFAGADGLDCIRRFIPACTSFLSRDGFVILEALTLQHQHIQSLCRAENLKHVSTNHLIVTFSRHEHQSA